jgi:flagellar motility protein MotE (MotC chaperone)
VKTIGAVILTIILVHLLAAAGGVAWLGLTNRLSTDRLLKVKDVFALTREDEAKKNEEQAKIDEQQASLQKEKDRMVAVADGPTTVTDRLQEDQMKRDIVLSKVQRLQREMEDMNRNLEFAKAQLAKEKKQLDADRLAFEQAKKDMETQRLDADFERVVESYSNIKPKLAKEAFMELIKQGQMDEVVEYLAAMQLRKSAAILNQFKADNEVPVAAQLLEALRTRGITPEGELPDGVMPMASK